MSDHPRPPAGSSAALKVVPGPIAPDVPYCTSCGHEATNHRHRRCWTDWQGNPISRTTSLIDCHCYGFTTTDLDESIARHPAGKGLTDA